LVADRCNQVNNEKIGKWRRIMKKFLRFAIPYSIGNIIVVAVLGGMLEIALGKPMPLALKIILISGLVLSLVSLFAYLYKQQK
jgi:hypothetical protein